MKKQLVIIGLAVTAQFYASSITIENKSPHNLTLTRRTPASGIFDNGTKFSKTQIDSISIDSNSTQTMQLPTTNQKSRPYNDETMTTKYSQSKKVTISWETECTEKQITCWDPGLDNNPSNLPICRSGTTCKNHNGDRTTVCSYPGKVCKTGSTTVTIPTTGDHRYRMNKRMQLIWVFQPSA